MTARKVRAGRPVTRWMGSVTRRSTLAAMGRFIPGPDGAVSSDTEGVRADALEEGQRDRRRVEVARGRHGVGAGISADMTALHSNRMRTTGPIQQSGPGSASQEVGARSGQTLRERGITVIQRTDGAPLTCRESSRRPRHGRHRGSDWHPHGKAPPHPRRPRPACAPAGTQARAGHTPCTDHTPGPPPPHTSQPRIHDTKSRAQAPARVLNNAQKGLEDVTPPIGPKSLPTADSRTTPPRPGRKTPRRAHSGHSSVVG
ncbi:hypothetical protein J2Z21_007309 [Streptomyces griseochromogenes]|uniref:Uncharacterized protein n=1 Tax=Streptomyces griseochromogenes TaxID=68214 RepID=A0ABS4M3Q5_9ACTN|nr:hypothetical protein [Streptomyces griseochromogenes]